MGDLAVKAMLLPKKVDGTKVLMANGQSAGIPKQLRETFGEAINEIAVATQMTPRHIMINVLPAGVLVPVHVDTVRDNPERWHLPLLTDVRHCYFWDEAVGIRRLEAGFWHKVSYSIPHAVGNYGKVDRIHLIVDLI